MPDTINAVETRYCCCSTGRLTPPDPARINGGVMMPANMASECCSPSNRPRNTGMRSLRPKKGAFLLADPAGFGRKGRFGRKRNA